MKKFIAVVSLSLMIINANAQKIQRWKIDDLISFTNQSKSTLLVFNFWATFCKPCVAEIPGMVSAASKYSPSILNFTLINLDTKSLFPLKLNRFIRKKHFNTKNVWLDEVNANDFCPKIDSSWSGSIPATLFINKKSGKRIFKEGEMTAKEFEEKLIEVLK
jgi:thiol-disulfide isomerase/thioredoxin